MIDFETIFSKVDENRVSSKDDRVLLIDGLNLFIRVFSVIPILSETGDHVGGIVGFLRSLGVTIRDFNPSRCIIVFDGKGGSLRRKKIFPDYKSGRTGSHNLCRDGFNSVEEERESMRKQMIRVVQYLNLLPVQIVCVDNIEADDGIAHLTMQYFQPKGSRVRIVSTDRDFYQLISNQVEVYSPVKKKLYTEKSLVDEFNLHSNNYLLYRTITGDLSDSIPGVNGIGLKTLLKAFPELLTNDVELDYIVERSKEIISKEKKPKKVFQSIVESSDVLYRNHRLMQLQDTDISLDSKLRIIGSIEQPINRVDKLQFRRYLTEDYLHEHFKNFDSWLLTTFNGLSLWATH